MPSLSNEQRAAIAIGVPVVALLLYLWYRRRRSSELLDEEQEYARVEENETVASANQRTVEVKVPHSIVGAIIGKSGANIKKIEKDSGARVNLKDEDKSGENEERIVLIQGEREKAKRAEILVKKIIAEQPVIRTEEVFVPQLACGRIIGKGGQTIRHMSSVSGAKIKIDRDSDNVASPLRRCFITGTSDQITSAKGLLDEKIAEDNEIRSRRGDMGISRYKRGARKLESAQASPTTGAVQFPKTIDFYEVFVSAIDNPGHFWVQLITEDSPHLDKLTEDLTMLHSSSESHAVLNALKVGDICCAPFEFDSSWYRARIKQINKDGTVVLYYVDFGDTGQVSKEKLRQLKPEHNRLPFQAIECYLAGVKPTGDEWNEESTEDFEQLSHCAQWVSLMARVIKYSGEIPCLELIDTTEQTDVNINEEMIKRKFAVRDVTHPPEEQGQVTEVIKDSTKAGVEQQETPEVSKQNILEQQEWPLTDTQSGDVNEETPMNGLKFIQGQSNREALSDAATKDVYDGPPSEDVTDSTPEFRGPVISETDSPVKAALVKTISQDYIPVPTSSSSQMSALEEGHVADLGVGNEQEITSNAELTNISKHDVGREAVPVSAVDLYLASPSLHVKNIPKPDTEEKPVGYRSSLNIPKPDTEEKPVGYRSSLNIAPSSKRTMAASFSGSRYVHVSEKSESSVKTVASTVHQQVVSSKQSYVSSVTIPEHSNSGNVIVSVTPTVTQLIEQSPLELDSHSFRASNESTTMTHLGHTVTSEVRQSVTQTNRGDTKTDFSASRLEKKLVSHSSPSNGNQTVTYKINFEGTPGTDPYTVTKTYTSPLENAPHTSAESSSDMSPSGSLLEISSNTVIDEEEEYEQEEANKLHGSSTSVGSESPEPDSDTESFMSAREDATSDTDAAAYMTAGGSSTSLYIDAVSLVDSATEDASTPVNSDTEVEEEEEVEACSAPLPAVKDANALSRSGTLKGLREQTTILGSGVTSDGDLGYRGDTEEGLTSTEDLRTAGT